MYRTALARTHRPRRFDELVGQDHIATTLRAAIESGRAAHAYLFCGPRGVGKTTAARIVAMALNCPNQANGEPCGACDSCDRIWSGRASLDVVEIDAASHRGVDDARDLRERAMYAPTSEERYKIYILDEAHMLTRDAWNALLKILEEPPPRVIFAFATTEPQKIEQGAAPVLSRCQRFDFRRVSVAEIEGRLETVLERESVDAEPGALRAIARRADGGVRDALSLLDQVLSFRADAVQVADVRRMLGLVDEERYLSLFGILAGTDRAAVFGFVQDLLDEGHDPAEFMRGLGDALRTLLALRLDPEAQTVDLLPESRQRFVAAAGHFTPSDLLRRLMVVSEFEASGALHRSAQQRIQLEVLLLRLASMESTIELEALLEALGGGGAMASDAGSPGPVAVPPRGGPTPGGSDGGRTNAPSPSGPAEASPPTEPAPTESRTGAAAVEGGSSASDGAPPPSGGPPPEASAASASGEPRRASSQTPPSDGPASALVDAWAAAVAETPELGGAAVALRGARVESLRDERLKLRVPAGLRADLEALFEDRKRSDALVRNLAGRLGADRLTVEIADESGGRMSAREASRQRVSNWMERDPRLREAVEELDLTLKEQ